VIEHRSLLELSLSIEKSLTWVFEQLVIRYYILVELSLEVQGGQDYFRFVEGTCKIACILYFSVLLPLSAALRLWTQVRLWTISDSESGNSFSERKKEKFLNALWPVVVRRGERMASKLCSLSRCSSPWRVMTVFCREVRFFTPKTQFLFNPIPNLIRNSTYDHSTTWTSFIYEFYGLSTLLTSNTTFSIIKSSFKL